jgi:hypothetical protein
MLPFYRKLLTLPVEDDKARLGFGEITDMIETISELQAQTDQRGAELATASAA